MPDCTFTDSDRQRFFSKFERGEPDACWEWQGTIQSLGYGHFFAQNIRHRAHRVAFFFAHGYWPKVCRHTCDNPPCVNPAHLVNGTQLDNIADRARRNRAARGERNGASPLTEDQVIEIRRLAAVGAMSLKAIGRKFNVSDPTVHGIVKRKYWTHI